MSPTDLELLQNLPLFQDLSPAQFEAAVCTLAIETIAPGKVLMHPDDEGETVYLVLSGSFEVRLEAEGEAPVLIGIRGTGDVLGEMSVLEGRERSATVIARETARVASLSRLAFWEKLWDMPPVAYNLVCLLNRRLRLLSERVRALSAPSAIGRTALQLDALFKEHGEPIVALGRSILPFALAPHELAAQANVLPAEAAAFLESWKGQGILKTNSKGHLLLLDGEQLRRAA